MEAKSIERPRRTTVPACSISEDGGQVTVKVEMPGVPKDKLEIKVEGNELTVAGDCEAGATKGRYLLRERHAEAYRKLFTLDDNIDHEKVDASFVDGILTLKLQVKEAAKPRRIEIG